MLRQILERLELTLNVAKTKIVNAHKGKFDFLGFSIWMGESRKTGKVYPHIQPSKKAEQVIKDRITELTKRDRTIIPLEGVVNPTTTSSSTQSALFMTKITIELVRRTTLKAAQKWV